MVIHKDKCICDVLSQFTYAVYHTFLLTAGFFSVSFSSSSSSLNMNVHDIVDKLHVCFKIEKKNQIKMPFISKVRKSCINISVSSSKFNDEVSKRK